MEKFYKNKLNFIILWSMLFILLIGKTESFACDCDVPVNNITSNITNSTITFNANKSYSSSCGCYELVVELKLAGQAFDGVTNIYKSNAGCINGAGSQPLNPVSLSLATIIAQVGPGEIKWRIKSQLSNGNCTLWSTSQPTFFSCTVAPSGNISASGPTQFCEGGSVVLNAPSGNSFQWFKNSAPISGANSATYTATTSGNYSVTSVVSGCPTSTVAVVVNPTPPVTVTATNSTINFGGSTTLTANVSSTKEYLISAADLLNVNNNCGQGSYYGENNQGFRWVDTGLGTVSNIKVEFSVGVECNGVGKTYTTSINNTAGPSYNQTTNWCSCSVPTGQSIVTLNYNSPSNYNVGGQNIFAITNANTSMGFFPAASLSNSYAKITVTYGSGGTTNYSWQPGNLTTNSITVSPTSTTTYTLIASDNIGCSTTIPTTITVNPPPVSFTLSGTNVSCLGGNDGSVTVNVVGGSGGIIEHSLDNAPFVANNVFTGLSAGNYSVRIKDGSYISDPMNVNVGTETNLPPVAIAQNLTVQLDPSGAATITAAQINNGSSDACGIKSMAVSPENFTCSNIGPNTVTLTVTDNNDEVSTAIATVTVEDKDAPAAVAKDITVQLNSAGTATITASDVNDGSSDACGIASLALDITSFNCSNVGANAVVLTLTDVNGNSSTANATVTVQDNVAPAVVTQNITVQLNAAGNATITAADVDNSSSDACGIASRQLDITTFGCANVGPNTVTLTVVDNNGNSASQTAVVTVEDNLAPVAIAQSITAQLDATGNVTVAAADVNNGSSDACGIASVELSKTSFNCSNIGQNTVVLTVTDVNGNSATANATVTVQDNDAPAVLTKNITVQLNAAGNATITAADVDNGSSDACGILSRTISKTSFDCSNVGANTVMLTITDNNGNSASANATVIVEDVTSPAVLTKPITIQLDASGNAAITAADIDNGSSDICGIASRTLSKTTFDCSNVGANTVTLTVTDNNGNAAQATATVTVQDVTIPTVVTQNISVNLVNGVATITHSNINDGSNDACGISYVGIDKTSFDCSNIGANTVTLTVRDNNGNTNTGTATVTVNGTIPAPQVGVTLVNSGAINAGNNKLIFLGHGSQQAQLNASNNNGNCNYKWSGAPGLSNLNIANPVFIPTVEGIYTFTVEATSASGCKAITTETITVIDAVCGNKGDKVMVCHNGKEICVAANAVPALMNQPGIELGSCNPVLANVTRKAAPAPTANPETSLKAFPNPFNTNTTIEFSVASEGKYKAELIDMKGQLVSVIAEGEATIGATYSHNLNRSDLANGMYLVRLVSASEVKYLKLMLDR